MTFYPLWIQPRDQRFKVYKEFGASAGGRSPHRRAWDCEPMESAGIGCLKKIKNFEKRQKSSFTPAIPT